MTNQDRDFSFYMPELHHHCPTFTHLHTEGPALQQPCKQGPTSLLGKTKIVQLDGELAGSAILIGIEQQRAGPQSSMSNAPAVTVCQRL